MMRTSELGSTGWEPYIIPKIRQEAKFVIVIDAIKVGIAGVLIQEDSEGRLRHSAYWARKLKDAETRSIAYDK